MTKNLNEKKGKFEFKFEKPSNIFSFLKKFQTFAHFTFSFDQNVPKTLNIDQGHTTKLLMHFVFNY